MTVRHRWLVARGHHIPTMSQLDLLGAPAPALPEGVRYREGVLTEEQERRAIEAVAGLDLKPFAFRGYVGNRRTASFGWHYDFTGGGLQRTGAIPEALLPFREIAAEFSGAPAESLEHLLAIEYSPGAGIGWHRDRPQFGVVVALSLLAPCRMRFRRRTGDGWERLGQDLAPRSAYALDGPGRTLWEHSIPAVDALRYSLTFRTLNKSAAAASRRSTR